MEVDVETTSDDIPTLIKEEEEVKCESPVPSVIPEIQSTPSRPVAAPVAPGSAEKSSPTSQMLLQMPGFSEALLKMTAPQVPFPQYSPQAALFGNQSALLAQIMLTQLQMQQGF